MPELPEVEHNRSHLERWIGGGRITVAKPFDPRIVRPLSGRAFSRALAGRRVARVERRGKWIRIALDDGGKLFVHLGMTGWFEPVAAGAPPLRFECVRLELTRRGSAAAVAYTDPRRWGRIVLARDDIATWSARSPTSPRAKTARRIRFGSTAARTSRARAAARLCAGSSSPAVRRRSARAASGACADAAFHRSCVATTAPVRPTPRSSRE
jgi:formamidopyrimidine-DNA glycosylase